MLLQLRFGIFFFSLIFVFVFFVFFFFSVYIIMSFGPASSMSFNAFESSLQHAGPRRALIFSSSSSSFWGFSSWSIHETRRLLFFLFLFEAKEAKTRVEKKIGRREKRPIRRRHPRSPSSSWLPIRCILWGCVKSPPPPPPPTNNNSALFSLSFSLFVV